MAKSIKEIESLCRNWTETLVNVLTGIATNKKAPESSRVAAAIAVLDRGWGRPAQKSDITVRRVNAREVTDDELANIIAGRSAGTSDETVDPSQLN